MKGIKHNNITISVQDWKPWEKLPVLVVEIDGKLRVSIAKKRQNGFVKFVKSFLKDLLGGKTMNDLISREAAIEETWKEPSYSDPLNILTEIRERIKAIQPAYFVEVRRGKWSDISGQAVLCSVCGKPQNEKQARCWRYCPHCGAVMECGI